MPSRIWERDGSLRHVLHGHSGRVWSVGWLPRPSTEGGAAAGLVYSTSSDGTAMLWDEVTGKVVMAYVLMAYVVMVYALGRAHWQDSYGL